VFGKASVINTEKSAIRTEVRRGFGDGILRVARHPTRAAMVNFPEADFWPATGLRMVQLSDGALIDHDRQRGPV
jgi:hypothetical protein